MKTISAFDMEANRIEELAERCGVTPAEVIESLFTIVDDNNIDIEDYI